MDIRHVSSREFFANPQVRGMLAEYAAESSICGMPAPNPDEDIYAALVDSGFGHFLVALDKGDVVGFVTIIINKNPHYSINIGVVESIFVCSNKRGTGAGLRLLREAEKLSAENGATHFLVSAPVGGKFAEVLSAHKAYRETNRVFFRKLT